MAKAPTPGFPNEVYNVEIERELLSEHSIQQAILEISKLSLSSGTATIDMLLELTSSHLQNALFGCAVDLGLYSDSNNKVLEFYVNKAYSRTIYRGESACFVSMDKKEIVVEVDALQNMVVFVPMVGTSRSYGVLEIHGLHPDDENFKVTSFRRSVEQLRGMLGAKDYRFISTARFWKKEAVKKYAGLDQVNSHFIMSGRVKDVVHSRNGVPFYGGPRFNILWESGRLEEEVHPNDLLQLFQETPQSLGVFTRLTSTLSEKLLYIGFLLGGFLESRKCELFLQELRTKMAVQRVNVVGMIEIALQSITTVLTGVRELYLLGRINGKPEAKTLLHYSFAKGTRATEVFDLNAFQIVDMLLEQSQQLTRSAELDGLEKGAALFRVGDKGNTDWLAREMIVPRTFKWGKSAHYDHYYLVLHKSYMALGGQSFSKFDEEVVCGVLEEIKSAITVLWQHDQRRKNLRDFIKIAESKLFEWRNLEINEMVFNLLNFIPEDLVQGHLYVGLLEPGAEELKYIAANSASRMEGERLRKDEGISFDVIETGATIVLNEQDFQKKALLTEGAVVDVYYGKRLYKAVVKRFRGHDSYDVEYKFDRKTEVGVHMDRILPMSRAFRAKQFNSQCQLPFIAAAVRHENKVLGVLGCDHMDASSLQNGRPSHDLQVFLEQIGRLVGSTVDTMIKKAALQSIFRTSKNQHAEIRDLVTTLIDSAFECSAYVQSVLVAQYTTQTVFQDYYSVTRCQLPPQILDRKGEVPKHLERKVMKLDYSKFGSRAVQRQGNDCILLLSHMRNASSQQDTPAAPGQGMLLLVAMSFSAKIPDVDCDFCETLQKAIHSVLFAILSQKASSEIRYDALTSIQAICKANRFPSRHAFFRTVSDAVSTCYHNTNMYVGMLNGFNQELHYMMASKRSAMMSKKLSRADGRGVSFQAVDEDRTLCILANSKLASKLRHFGERQHFEYPFIVTPIVCHIDSVVGVLAADNCAGQQVTSDAEESLSDVISFFSSIAIYLNKAVRFYRVEDTIKAMQRITETSGSYAEGVSKLLQLLFDFLPFATRVHHLTFEPSVLTTLETNELGVVPKEAVLVTDAEVLQEGFTIVLTIARVSYVSPELQSASIRVYWQGNCLSVCSCALLDHVTDAPPILVRVPKFSVYADANVTVKIFGKVPSHNGTLLLERELCQSVLDLRYFIHTPLTIQYHSLFSPLLHNMKAAQVGVLSRIVPSDVVLGYYVDSVELKYVSSKGTQQTEEDFHRDYKEVFVTFYWENVSVGRSRLGADAVAFKWDGLDLFIPIHHGQLDAIKDAATMDFLLELSCMDAKNQSTVVGTLQLTQKELQEYLSGKPAWLEVQRGALQATVTVTGAVTSIRSSVSRPSHDVAGFFVQLAGANIDGHNILRTRDFKEQKESNHHVLYELLKVPRPASTRPQGRESTLIESRKLVSFQNRDDGIKCEIGVLAARDLFIVGNPNANDVIDRGMNTLVKVFFNQELIGTTSIAHDSYMPTWSKERFHIVLFPDDDMENNAVQLELYRYMDDASAPAEAGLTAGIEDLIGSVEIKGFDLTTLLMGTMDHEAWFDAERVQYPPRHGMITSKKPPRGERYRLNKLLTTQLKVCGRLSSHERAANVTGKKAKDRGYLEVNVGTVSGMAAAIPKTLLSESALLAASYTVTLYLNDRCIWSTAAIGLLEVQKESDSKGHDELVFTGERVLMRFPCNRTLYQSRLRMDLMYSVEGQAPSAARVGKQVQWETFASATVTGSQIVSFLGQTGTVTKTFALRLSESLLKQRGKIIGGKAAPTEDRGLCVQMRGGPEDAPEVFQYDDYTLCLDLLAAVELPQRYPSLKQPTGNNAATGGASSVAVKKMTADDTRPELVCVITWNGKVMGKTAVAAKGTHVIFHQQRLFLPVPLFHSSQPRLFQCSLQIDFYDHIVTARTGGKLIEKLLGTVYMDGFAIEQFCQRTEHIDWVDINKPFVDEKPRMLGNDSFQGSVRSFRSSVSGDSDHNTVATSAKYSYSERSETASVGALKMQLRAQSNPTDLGSGSEADEALDYLLRIVQAKDLSNTDPYGGANATVEVHWNGIVVGSTQVVRGTVHPVYSDEIFILRADGVVRALKSALANGVALRLDSECLLELQVWSLALNKPKDFLGRVTLQGQHFLSAVLQPVNGSTPPPRDYTLRPSNEFTHEENALVHGSLCFELTEIRYSEFIHSAKMTEEAVIWINSAQHIPELSVWNYEPSFYCRIVRSYEREGGEKVEIYRTQTVGSFSPRFSHEFCALTIPADEDWTGFMLEFEVCYREVVMASLVLSTDALRALVMRSGTAVTECLSFPMQANPEIVSSHHATEPKQPMLLLAGGLKVAFDAKMDEIENYYSRIAALENAETASVDSEMLLEAAQAEAQQSYDWPAYFVSPDAQSLELHFVNVHGRDVDRLVVQVLWNDSEVMATNAKNIAQATAALRLQIEKAIGNILLECELKLRVIDPVSSSVVATVTVKKRQLAELLEARALGTNCTLRGEERGIDDGVVSIHVWARLSPQFTTSQLASPQAALPKHGEEVFLSILAAADLSKAGILGSTDAFAVVTFCGHKVLETPVVKEKLDPVWLEPQVAILRLPMELDPYASIFANRGLGVDRTMSMDDEGFSVRSDANLRSGDAVIQPVEDYWIVDDLELNVEFFHQGKSGRHSFLGSVELKGESVRKLLFSQEPYVVKWFELGASPSRSAAEQKLVNRTAKVSVVASRFPAPSMSARTASSNALEGKEVDFFAISARGLPVEKSADCFAVVRVLGSMCGKTYVDRGCGSAPRWDNEKFTLRLPLMVLADCLDASKTFPVVTCEVWQSQKKGNVMVGSGTVRYEQFLQCLDSDHAQSLWLPLQTATTAPEKVRMKDVGGEVEMRLMYSNPLAALASLGDMVNYRIVVSRILNAPLGNVASGVSLFVIGKWNDREIGRTGPASIKAGVPTWQDQELSVTVDKKSNLAECILLLEVWSQGALFGGGSCVGSVLLFGDDLVNVFQPAGETGAVDGSTTIVEGKVHLLKLTDPTKAGSPRASKRPLSGELEVAVDAQDLSAGEHIAPKGAAFGSRGLKDIAVRWQDLIDAHAGSSIVEIKLVSSMIAFVSSTLLNAVPPRASLFGIKKETISSCKVLCRVVWCGAHVFDSAPMDVDAADGGAKVLSWAQDAEGQQFEHTCYLNNSLPGVKQNDKTLRFELWLAGAATQDGLGAEALAAVDLPFQILLRLYCGQFTFPLQPGSQVGHINSLTNSISLVAGSPAAALQKWHNKLWQCNITFQVKFVFSFWDSVRYSAPSIYKRKVAIYGGFMLPAVDNEFPNTKCVVSIDDVVIAKSTVVAASANPVYPRLYADILIDLTKPLRITVQVVHIHAKTRREVVLGQDAVPFEYLLKPPNDAFDLYLGPSRERKENSADSEFRFSLSGYVKVQVFGANQLEADQLALSSAHDMAHSYALASSEYAIVGQRPDASVQGDDDRSLASKMGVVGNGVGAASFLTIAERGRLGTCSGLAQPQPSANLPAFLLLPLHDIGVVIGRKKSNLIGTTPGNRSALAIERDPNRLAISDASLLEDIAVYLSTSVVKLRWKDINRELRDLSLKYLAIIAKKFSAESHDLRGTQDLSDLNERMLDVVIRLISHCIPGCMIRKVSRSADHSLLYYDHYPYRLLVATEDGKSAAEAQQALGVQGRVAMPAQYGSDSAFFDRCFGHSFLLHHHSDLEKRCVALFSSLVVQRFPRFNLVIGAEDASLGLLQIENFDGINGGMVPAAVSAAEASKTALSSFDTIFSTPLYSTNKMTSTAEVRKWLEGVGQVAGELQYINNEHFVFSKLRDFFRTWEYSLDLLLQNLLHFVPVVLRNCQMLEVLHIDAPDFKIKSLMESRPAPTVVYGQKVTLTGIVLSRKRAVVASKWDEDQSDGGSSFRTDSSHLTSSSSKAWQGLKGLFKGSAPAAKVASEVIHEDGEDENEEGEGDFDQDESAKLAADSAWHAENRSSAFREPPAAEGTGKTFVCALRYDGVEQIQVLALNADTQNLESVCDVQLLMKINKQVAVALYEIDDHWNVLAESRGTITLAVQSGQQKIVLEAIAGGATSAFDMVFTVDYSERYGAAANLEAQFGSLHISGIRLQVVGARGLKPLKAKTAPSAFCEVYVDKKMISSTSTVKHDLNPTWNHSVHIPYKQKAAEVYIDIYDMSFLRKGNFLGRVELPFDQLVSPASADACDFVLQPRMDFTNVKKNAFVGGSLQLKITVDKLAPQAQAAEAAPGSGEEAKAKHKFRAGVDGIRAAQTMLTATEDDPAKQMMADALADLNRIKKPVMLLTVERGSDLPVGNRFSGTSDPFVVVSFVSSSATAEKDKAAVGVAKTRVVSGNHMTPVWEETLQLPLLSGTDEKEAYSLRDLPMLRLAAMHYNKLTAPGLLGAATIQPALYLLENSATMPLAVKRKVSDKDKDKDKAGTAVTEVTQGTLSVRWSIVDETTLSGEADNAHTSVFRLGLHRHVFPICTLSLRVVKVSNLVKLRRVWGGYNPFVAIFHGGRLVAQTKHKTATSSPAFNEQFTVPLCVCGDQTFGDVVLRVFSKDPVHQDLFLGECAFSFEDLAHGLPVDGQEVTHSLKGRVGADQVSAEGTLTLKMSVAHIPQSLPLFPITAHQATTLAPELPHASRQVEPVVLTYDPALEAARQRKEGLQLPELAKKVGLQSQKYLSRPFERTGLITEGHYGQLCAAFRRGDRTILKTELSDSACIPLFRKNSPQAELFPRYLVCRYKAHQIPRRDLRFLEGVQGIVAAGLQEFADRDGRRKALEALVEHSQLLAQASSSPHDLVQQGVLEMETALKCPVRCFLLSEQGSTLLPVSIETGKAQPQAGAAGAAGGDFAQTVARLARHDLMLQFYRGEVRVIKASWDAAAFTQYQLPGIEAVQEALDAVEGDGFCAVAVDQLRRQLPDGGFVVPLLQEALLGVLVVKQINALPAALYNYYDRAAQSDLLRLESLEHQQANLLLQASRHFARGLLATRVSSALKAARSFSVTLQTSAPLLLRYMLRLLVTACPWVRDVSVWMVDTQRPVLLAEMRGLSARAGLRLPSMRGPSMRGPQLRAPSRRAPSMRAPSARAPSMRTTSVLDVDDEEGAGRPDHVPLLARLFGFGAPKPSAPSSSEASVASSLAEAAPPKLLAGASGAAGTNAALRIKLGVFGSTNPTALLNAPNERGLGGPARKAKETPADAEATRLAEFKIVPAVNALSPQPQPGSGSSDGTARGSPVTGKTVAETVLDEVRLCAKLKQRTFRVASGHLLSRFAEDTEAHELLCALFQVPKPQAEEQRAGSGLLRGLSRGISGLSMGSARERERPRERERARAQSKAVLREPSAASLAPAPPPPPPLSETLQFFLAVNSHGVGGQSGWGVLGPQAEELVAGLLAALDTHLTRLYALQEAAADLQPPPMAGSRRPDAPGPEVSTKEAALEREAL